MSLPKNKGWAGTATLQMVKSYKIILQKISVNCQVNDYDRKVLKPLFP